MKDIIQGIIVGFGIVFGLFTVYTVIASPIWVPIAIVIYLCS